MFYGEERGTELTPFDLFDNQMMTAQLSAAKDLYDRDQEQQKQFYKEYGNFYSPIKKDMDTWYQNTTKGSQDLLNAMSDNNVDPTSLQGRAIISKYINTRPYGELAAAKQRSAVAQQYLQNKAQLEAAGKYNEDFERARHNGKSIEDWDPSKDGEWTSTSPSQFQDLYGATHDWFEGMGNTLLYNKNGYNYYGIDKNKMNGVVNDQLKDFTNTDLGKYYLNNVYGGDENKLKQDIVTRNQKIISKKPEVDEWAMARQKHAWDIQDQNRQFAHEDKMAADKLAAKKQTGSGFVEHTFFTGTNAHREGVYNLTGKDIFKAKSLKEAMGIQGQAINNLQSSLYKNKGTNKDAYENFRNTFGISIPASGGAASLGGNVKQIKMSNWGFAPNKGIKLYTTQGVMRQAYGYNNNWGHQIAGANKVRTRIPDKVNINDDDIKGVTPVGGDKNAVCVLGKDGRYHISNLVDVTYDTHKNKLDTTGKPIINSKTKNYEHVMGKKQAWVTWTVKSGLGSTKPDETIGGPMERDIDLNYNTAHGIKNQ